MAAVRDLRQPSVQELAMRLWPGIPWLPERTRFRCLRSTLRLWSVPAPLPDGRTAWEASAAAWLYRECEALVKRGALEHAPVGEVPLIDLLTTTRYRLPIDSAPERSTGTSRWRRRA